MLSCMAYVDLSPVRAKICDQLEDSEHTSITKRIESVAEKGQGAGKSESVRSLRPGSRAIPDTHVYVGCPNRSRKTAVRIRRHVP